jgi:hypothetical protein
LTARGPGLVIFAGSCHCGLSPSRSTRRPLARAGLQLLDLHEGRFLHLIVPKSRFRLLRGEGNLTTYTFNTGVAKHTFCRTCGMKPFYTPRSNPDGIDVNVHCLDPVPGIW